jgi:hypothetical protein
MASRISLGLLLVVALAAAGFAPTPEPHPLVVIDSAGKEQKLKTWKFTIGVRHLTWLAPAPPVAVPDENTAAPKSRARPLPVGPEALEFREEESTAFVEGVLTFVLLDRLRGKRRADGNHPLRARQ